MEQGTITVTWTRAEDGTFDWRVTTEGAALSDDQIEALLTEIAARI